MTASDENAQEKISRLLGMQDRLEASLKLALLRVEALRVRADQNADRILSLRISSGQVLGPRNKKNDQMYQFWSVIEPTLKHPEAVNGMLQRELFGIAEKELPHLKLETFRSYLHRIKNAGLIEKRGPYWAAIKPNISKDLAHERSAKE